MRQFLRSAVPRETDGFDRAEHDRSATEWRGAAGRTDECARAPEPDLPVPVLRPAFARAAGSRRLPERGGRISGSRLIERSLRRIEARDRGIRTVTASAPAESTGSLDPERTPDRLHRLGGARRLCRGGGASARRSRLAVTAACSRPCAAGAGGRPVRPAGQCGAIRIGPDRTRPAGEERAGRAGPLPLPPGGMFCEFTRPYPAQTPAMAAAAGFAGCPVQPHVL